MLTSVVAHLEGIPFYGLAIDFDGRLDHVRLFYGDAIRR